MDDDGWEEAALSTRHLHNRNDRAGTSTRHEFDIRQAFGTHLVKCPALEGLKPANKGVSNEKPSKKKKKDEDHGPAEVVLDIFRLTDDKHGLLGSLRCPGVLEAVVVFAGSRKTLWNVTRTLELAGHDGTTNDDYDDDDDEDDDDDDDDDHDDSYNGANGINRNGTSPTSREDKRRNRIATFEKNSFRQPKFWLRWQAVTAEAHDDGKDEEEEKGSGSRAKNTTNSKAREKEKQKERSKAAEALHGSGYIVFSGNDCRRFQGTMTCGQLEWNNVKMTGWKAKPQPERDFDIRWQGD